MTSIVVHYKELALKGRTARGSSRSSIRNLRDRARRPRRRSSVRSVMGRIEIELGPGRVVATRCASGCGRVFGIANFSYAGRGAARLRRAGRGDPRTISAIAQVPIVPRQRRAAPTSGFRSPRRRSSARSAGLIKEAKGWRVDLERPGADDPRRDAARHAFYFFGKEPGAGGLPTGTGGRVACLLSGGIDSPVAAYRMMRRGCSVLLIHFHSYPILSRASQEKVREIAALLTRYQLRSRLMLVPFGELQQQVRARRAGRSCAWSIYRRLMLRIAERLARRVARARAGHRRGDRPGGVADAREPDRRSPQATTLEVLRPLVGMDKDEITARGRADRDAADLEHPRPGLLHAVHAAASGDARAAGRRRARRAGAADRRDGGRPRWRPSPWRTSDSRC